MPRNDHHLNSNCSRFLRVNPLFRRRQTVLPTLSMNAFSAEREEFLRDLNLVCASLAAAPRIKSFRADLERVQAFSETAVARTVPISSADLASLGREFDRIWESAREKLGGEKWWERLPVYHPLRCPISLFGTLDLGLHETAHTRALAWLLDPGKEHGFGDVLLHALLRKVFAKAALHLSDVTVTSEFRSGESRDRIDIHLQGSWTDTHHNGAPERWTMIIEAKIRAEEGDAQLARYEKQTHMTDRHKLVFLTTDSRSAVTGSQDGKTKWIPLSFKELMALFNNCLPELKGKPGFEFLRLYMAGVLKDIYQMRGGENIGERADIYGISEYLWLCKNGGNSHD